MKKPILNKHERNILKLHREGTETWLGAGLECRLALLNYGKTARNPLLNRICKLFK